MARDLYVVLIQVVAQNLVGNQVLSGIEKGADALGSPAHRLNGR